MQIRWFKIWKFPTIFSAHFQPFNEYRLNDTVDASKFVLLILRYQLFCCFFCALKIYPQSFVIVDDKIVFATELSKTEILSFYALSSNILDYVRFGVTQLQCQIDKIGVNDKVTNGNGLFKLNTNFFVRILCD